MRQRRIKNVEEKIEEFNYLIAKDPASRKGDWRSGSDRKLFLEIGCGKGDFISSIAELHPENLYIAAEGLPSVVLRALTKVHDAGRENVIFITEYINDMETLFSDGELDGIFLNFSDPWPKNRYAKRRLTYSARLLKYSRALKPGGFVRFKTDNRDLFDFSIEEMKESGEETGLEISFVTYDLRGDADEKTLSYATESPITEYEKKFMERGSKICFVELIKK